MGGYNLVSNFPKFGFHQAVGCLVLSAVIHSKGWCGAESIIFKVFSAVVQLSINKVLTPFCHFFQAFITEVSQLEDR